MAKRVTARRAPVGASVEGDTSRAADVLDAVMAQPTMLLPMDPADGCARACARPTLFGITERRLRRDDPRIQRTCRMFHSTEENVTELHAAARGVFRF